LKKYSIKYTALAIYFIVGSTYISFSQNENAKYAKFMNVKSWTASYTETYTSEKTWEMRPGVTMKTSIHSTISGTYKLEKQMEDGYLSEDWYGYGNGSSIMDQIVIMSSNDPKITITEKTHSASSGSIGIPSKNEYGEFWGGNFSIDIYSGTYGFGFGGPEADDKSTFTRTVEGLPTDYQEMNNLPEGLREIFVPLGEKAEEWAAYSGPLEDAKGIMVAGLAGFQLFPDMDEPEKKLPESGMVLKGSYSGKNIIKSWTIAPSGMELPKVFLEIVDKDWIPEDENTVEVKLSWENVTPYEVEFTLFDISKEPGICLNSEDKNMDPDMDIIEDNQSEYFQLIKSDEHILALNKNPEKKELTLVINSLDYGAHAKIKARINVADLWYDAEIKELGGNELHIPFDKNENHIADKWEKEVGIFSKNYLPKWDEDPKPKNQKSDGDGFTLYEEYRGFQEIGHVFRNGDNEQVKDGHVRMDPMHKDVFIYDKDFLFRQYYKPDNPANLNWHVIDLGNMKSTGKLESDPNFRWVNFNTSKKYFIRNQYAIYIVSKGVGQLPAFPTDVGYTYALPDCNDSHGTYMRYVFPLRCIYMTAIFSLRIVEWADSAEKNGATFDDRARLYQEQMTTTVIHEIGHQIGIRHHYPDKDDGVRSCAIRYDHATEKDNVANNFLRTRYCTKQEPYSTFDGSPGLLLSDDCYGQINIKGN